MAISGVTNYLGTPRAGGVSGLFYEGPDLTFAWGDRLHEYQEPITEVRRMRHAELGEFAVRGDAVRALTPQRAAEWELEIVLSDPPGDEVLTRMFGYAVRDGRVVGELVRAYAVDASRRHTAITDERAFPSLVALGVQRLDIFVATAWNDRGFQFCARLVRVFWTHDWLLTIWNPAGGAMLPTHSVAAKWEAESAEARSAALPARRPYHVAADLPHSVSGHEALIRFAYYVAGHHEWSVTVISATLEQWQSNFFEAAGDGRGTDPLALMALLSDVGRSIVLMRPALQRLQTTFKLAPFREHVALGGAAERDARALSDVSAQVREAYALAASGASIYQAFQTERKTATDRRLQRVASVLAAVILWPGLVAALYGADIRGLPGQGTKHGLLVVVVVSGIGALISLLALSVTLRNRDG